MMSVLGIPEDCANTALGKSGCLTYCRTVVWLQVEYTAKAAELKAASGLQREPAAPAKQATQVHESAVIAAQQQPTKIKSHTQYNMHKSWPHQQLFSLPLLKYRIS